MRVASLNRHPIKSHGREQIETVTLVKGQTMPWDRVWAVTHEATKFDAAAPAWAHCRNFMIGARTPGLLGIWASLDEAAATLTLRHKDLGDITFRPDASEDVARFLDWVAPLCPDNRSGPTGIVSAPGRGMTDSALPCISIMNMASHDAVADAVGTPLEMERWRGNIFLEDTPAWAELEWLGRDVRIGEATLRVRERIERCTVTHTNPMTGERDIDILSVLDTHFGHKDFGVNAEVITPGTVTVGARVEVL
ncbi:MOSC domain-containing protein [uncultured Tateyamaria sp.]|uniref:MOSC domain-containing protein n=1 Tax=uncultured Tateyamaria sp. TaxID=455651 RepID=UPI002638B863|nr:MOSC domain-containing protein [uncultured Tateyamaria sp.]